MTKKMFVCVLISAFYFTFTVLSMQKAIYFCKCHKLIEYRSVHTEEDLMPQKTRLIHKDIERLITFLKMMIQVDFPGTVLFQAPFPTNCDSL